MVATCSVLWRLPINFPHSKQRRDTVSCSLTTCRNIHKPVKWECFADLFEAVVLFKVSTKCLYFAFVGSRTPLWETCSRLTDHLRVDATRLTIIVWFWITAKPGEFVLHNCKELTTIYIYHKTFIRPFFTQSVGNRHKVVQ